MDKICDYVAEVLFSLERLSNTLRKVVDKPFEDTGYSYGCVPTLEESLPAIAGLVDNINESLIDMFFEKDDTDND